MSRTTGSRAFAAACILLVLFFCWKIFDPFLVPIAWAAVLAILLHSPYRWLARKTKHSNFSALLATVATLLIVVVPGVLVGFALVSQGVRLYKLISAYFASHQVYSASDFLALPFVGKLMAKITSRIPVTGADLQVWTMNGLKAAGGWVAARISSLAVGFFGFLVSLFIMVFTLFFFFRDGESIWRRLIAALPFEDKEVSVVEERLRGVLQAVLAGTLLTGLLQGVLGGVGFAIFGLPSPVVFGALMFVFSLLPVGGTALVWGPAAIILLAQGSWGRGIGLAAWGVVISVLADNWFKPMIISGKSQINTLPVFFGVMGGLAAFGFLGLFLGPLVVVLGLTLWNSAALRNTGVSAENG